MVLTEFERDLIVKAVGRERMREAERANQQRQALEQLPWRARNARFGAARMAIGIAVMRAGARLAGVQPRLTVESR